MIETKAIATRKKMLVSLSEDLAAAGWDQPNKLWMVLGDEGDEYLEYVGSYDMDSPHWMMHRAEEGTLRESVRGVVTCYESWTYPDTLSEKLSDNQVSQAYRYLVPPDEHPDHGSVRTIVLVTRDGTVMRADRYSTRTESDTSVMDEVSPTGNTGDRLVDFMRSILGTSSLPEHPLHSLSLMLTQDNGDMLKNILIEAATKGWDQTRISAEVYKSSPDEVKRSLDATMPEAVRKYLDDEQQHPE